MSKAFQGAQGKGDFIQVQAECPRTLEIGLTDAALAQATRRSPRRATEYKTSTYERNLELTFKEQ